MAYSALGARGILRRGDGARVELSVTEPLLREFLTLLESAQEELNQRWNGQGTPGRHVEHA
ncbi:hypothetical protein [Streptomyces olivochromogenes]|uniref:hypothetical protein n=1 Tax=Streptomyces olivochromogenes TaxID=1963 RepID=UPI001F1FB110|nr:hypothetical protein [Streptomyces olivochromogenes]MCF3131215.1 hypothetical protein [Streptomyces olivochromogenes]